LPDKTYSFIPIELDNEKEYKEAERDFISWIKKEKGQEAAKKASNAEAFAKIEGLKQLTIKGKLKSIIEWINDFLETDQKLVIFCTHLLTIEKLMNEFNPIAVKMDGSVPNNKRQNVVDKFQNNPDCKLFIGMIDKQGDPAGVGWTLTAASNVAFIELQWSPKTHDQASDRCHRITQKDAVNIYYLLAKNTIEEKIAKLQDSKRNTIDGIMDGIDTPAESLLSEIMKSYT
jgi:SWI/SNF-related matrix-associated actin-dependent regulator 1 of chromatin subfamily A